MWQRTSPHRGLQQPPQCSTHRLRERSPVAPPECGSLGPPKRAPTRMWHATQWPSDPVSLQNPSVSTPEREAPVPPGTKVTTHPSASALLTHGMHAGPKPTHGPDSNVYPHRPSPLAEDDEGNGDKGTLARHPTRVCQRTNTGAPRQANNPHACVSRTVPGSPGLDCTGSAKRLNPRRDESTRAVPGHSDPMGKDARYRSGANTGRPVTRRRATGVHGLGTRQRSLREASPCTHSGCS